MICYIYKEILLFLLIELYSDYNTSDFYFIFTNITEVFSVYFELVIFISFQFFLFFILYHAFIFLSPAFFAQEYRYVKVFVSLIYIFWMFSVFLSYYLLVPFAWNFFISFQSVYLGQSFYFEAKLIEYFKFCVSIYSFCFIYCQIFPFLMCFFFDIYSKKKHIKKFRKIFYYIFAIFATLISPPEVYCQIILSLVLIFFYESVILILMFNLYLNKLVR